MIGIVQEAPGRWDFLYLYTVCSRMSKLRTTATVVVNHVGDPEEENKKEGRGTMPTEEKGVWEGTTADECAAAMVVGTQES